MKENIMSYIGKLVFVFLCVKYRNDQDEYLAIMKIDRMDNHSGLTSFEYSDWIKTKEQEQGFLNNFEDKSPSQYLDDIQKGLRPHSNVGVEQ